MPYKSLMNVNNNNILWSVLKIDLFNTEMIIILIKFWTQYTFWVVNLYFIEYFTVAQLRQLDLIGPKKSNQTVQGQLFHTLLPLYARLCLLHLFIFIGTYLRFLVFLIYSFSFYLLLCQ